MNESDKDGERIASLEARADSNTRRIEVLEESTSALNRLATSVEVMATKQSQIASTVATLDHKVDALERKPVKRWDDLVDKAIWAVAAAVIAFLLARIGL